MATTNVREKVCIRCKQTKPFGQFKNSPSPFLPQHRSMICTQCLEQMVDPTDLNKVDKLMQHLDLPFDLNEWTKLYDTHKEHTLTAYFNRIADESYDGVSWKDENERWKDARENNVIDEEMEVFSKAEMSRLRKKWSEFYSASELRFLEAYYNQICATQIVSTPILREYACDLCELELQIKKGVRNGEDVKKLMDAKNNIIQIAHFEASNAKNAADFDSVGEVISWCIRKGWHPNWHTEPQDSIDFLMKNAQNWWVRFARNEGNFSDQVETKEESYNLRERLSEEEQEYKFDIDEQSVIEYEDDNLFGDDENG